MAVLSARAAQARRTPSSTPIVCVLLLILLAGILLYPQLKPRIHKTAIASLKTIVQVTKEKEKEKDEDDFDGKLVLKKPALSAPSKPRIFRSTYVQRRYVVDEGRAPQYIQRRYVQDEPRFEQEEKPNRLPPRERRKVYQ